MRRPGPGLGAPPKNDAWAYDGQLPQTDVNVLGILGKQVCHSQVTAAGGLGMNGVTGRWAPELSFSCSTHVLKLLQHSLLPASVWTSPFRRLARRGRPGGTEQLRWNWKVSFSAGEVKQAPKTGGAKQGLVGLWPGLGRLANSPA